MPPFVGNGLIQLLLIQPHGWIAFSCADLFLVILLTLRSNRFCTYTQTHTQKDTHTPVCSRLHHLTLSMFTL